MAKPIKITPVLKGKEAVKFFEKLQQTNSSKTFQNASIKKEADSFRSLFKKS